MIDQLYEIEWNLFLTQCTMKVSFGSNGIDLGINLQVVCQTIHAPKYSEPIQLHLPLGRGLGGGALPSREVINLDTSCLMLHALSTY